MGSISRLMIGSFSIGLNELSKRMKNWEEEAAPPTQDFSLSQDDKSLAQELRNNVETGEIIRGEILPIAHTNDADTARYALLGMIVDLPNRAEPYERLLNRTSRAFNNTSKLLIGPLQKARILSPFRSRYNTLVKRGEDEVRRWVIIGKKEIIESQTMVEVAAADTVDETLESLGKNEDIKNLIQSQSIGLANEIVKEFRERAVTSDNFIEAVLRFIMRRKSRSDLSPPPEEVQMKAFPMRQILKETSKE